MSYFLYDDCLTQEELDEAKENETCAQQRANLIAEIEVSLNKFFAPPF
jgi:hypothetical protein